MKLVETLPQFLVFYLPTILKQVHIYLVLILLSYPNNLLML